MFLLLLFLERCSSIVRMYKPAKEVVKEKAEELKKGDKKRTLVLMKQADGQVASVVSTM